MLGSASPNASSAVSAVRHSGLVRTSLDRHAERLDVAADLARLLAALLGQVALRRAVAERLHAVGRGLGDRVAHHERDAAGLQRVGELDVRRRGLVLAAAREQRQRE